MPPTSWIRLSALAGVICGLSIAAGGLSEIVVGDKTTASGVPSGLAPGFGLAFLVGLYLFQRRAFGTFGHVAFVLNYLGLAVFGGAAFAINFVLQYLHEDVVDELFEGPAKLAFLGAALLMLVGTVSFGIAMYRANAVPRPAVLLYLGFVPVTLSFALPDLVNHAGHMVAGAGIVWLSLVVRARSGRAGEAVQRVRSGHESVAL